MPEDFDSLPAGRVFPVDCPNCESPRVTSTLVEHSFPYGKPPDQVELKALVRLFRCESCGFEFTDESGDDARQDAVCKHLGVLTPSEIVALRKRYGMSRSHFAELTRLGEATIARWERGALIQTSANDQYLRLLAVPENMERLRQRTLVGGGLRGARFRCLTPTQDLRIAQERFELRPTGT